jgi:acyl-homoserine-lactone acylase
MQRDRVDKLVEKFKKVLFEPAFLGKVQDSMENWPDAEKIRQAREALDVLRAFDGDMSPDSRAAAVMGLFQDILIHKVFADELGGLDSAAGQSFLITIEMSYGADQDHLLGRPDSPFWDDVRTPQTESKADIFAECLAGAVIEAEDRMGRDRETWRWGRLLTYSWRTQTTQLKKFLPAWQRPVVGLIGRYTDRGPFPAGGSFNTVSVAGHSKGERYDVWLVPAMRMVVDFGLEEPMFLTNSGGQSGNPASLHYDDAIDVWMAGETRPMPFQEEAIKAQYTKEFVLKPSR